MNEALDRLARVLDSVPARLSSVTEEQAAARAAEGRWSAKEIIGHLIDSASNNHQRFLRAQLAPTLEISSYEQESWVAAQDYAGEPWANLVALWAAYNRHLLHVMQRIPANCLSHPWLGYSRGSANLRTGPPPKAKEPEAYAPGSYGQMPILRDLVRWRCRAV